MGEPIRVLYVDDNDASLRFRARLMNEFETIDVETATDVSEGLCRLDEADFDCVLSDLNLPVRDGIDFLAAVREQRPGFPFILFTTAQPRNTVERALAADVTDYVVKQDVDECHEVLINRIQQFVAHYRAKQRLGELREEVERPSNVGQGN